MLILLALIAGAAIGIAAHYTLPHRSTRGVVLAPAIGTASAGLVYTALQWAGLDEGNVWLWVASIGTAAVVTYLAVSLLSRARVTHDQNERVRLNIA